MYDSPNGEIEARVIGLYSFGIFDSSSIFNDFYFDKLFDFIGVFETS
jgi:hypothetical protein